MGTPRSVFVSHSHTDNVLCDRYVTALRARGVDAWYDRSNAQQGHFLGDEIQRELQRRSAFVLLMTPTALDSFWVKLELQSYLGLMAQDPSRLLLSIKIAPCEAPPFLNALLWVDAMALGFDGAVEAVVRALSMPATPGTSAPSAGLSTGDSTTLPDHPTPHVIPKTLTDLGFQMRVIRGVELVLPPLRAVPAGPFIMGSDLTVDPQAFDDETPLHTAEVGAFQIGTFPVTVAEYACAVRAGVVREPPKGTYRPMEWRYQLQRPDHPVACVSWRNAAAYAGWLATMTGQHWRLPTEAEWEKAARGTDGRIFPWGGYFDPARCNTVENGNFSSTPVGSYPNGVSPYGVHDMAGNVWEWTSSIFMPYPYRANDGREDADPLLNRTLHGGSWGGNSRNARAAYRNRIDPPNLNISIGFRLAFGGPGG